MKITLVMVMSANGKTTKGEQGPNFWASAEDQEHFEILKQKAQVIVMGRKTFDQAKDHIKDDGKKRIVMSRETGFVLPTDVDEILLVGGSELNAEFFKRKLINEIYLTIEPEIFGTGLPLAQAEGLDVQLELLNVKQLNSKGTLLLHYKCLNSKK